MRCRMSILASGVVLSYAAVTLTGPQSSLSCHQKVKQKMNNAFNWRLILPLLTIPNFATAVPLKDFIDTGFIGGGVMLFVAGVVMLFIPRMFRWGVITMLIADALFMVRMFFRKDLTIYLTSQGNYGQLIEEMGRDASRFLTIMGVVSTVMALLVVRALMRGFFGGNDAHDTKRERQSMTRRARATKQQEVSRGKRPRIDRDLEPEFGQQPHQQEFR